MIVCSDMQSDPHSTQYLLCQNSVTVLMLYSKCSMAQRAYSFVPCIKKVY